MGMSTPMFRFRSVVIPVACLAAMLGWLAGCASPAGVEVVNQTGQVINVEYLSVAGDGSTHAYSTGVVSKNGAVFYKVDASQGNGAKIRFSLPEAPMDEASAVTLKLPDERTRYFDLEYRSGKLIARERFLGRSNPSRPQ